jgi:hypothetical protein
MLFSFRSIDYYYTIKYFSHIANQCNFHSFFQASKKILFDFYFLAHYYLKKKFFVVKFYIFYAFFREKPLGKNAFLYNLIKNIYGILAVRFCAKMFFCYNFKKNH